MLGGGASEQTRQPRTRPDATADDGNSRTPRTSAGAVEGAPKHAPISGSFAETITEIVKSARQKRQLCEEQELELRRCLPVLLSSTSSPLEQGHALLRVIENQLMPAWESGVENSWKLFKLSQLDVREFVELARLDRHQNGRRPALTAGELCASVSSTDTALPAQSTSPSVELAQPDTTEPPVALADANKHPAPLDTALTATDAELNLAAWVNKAPVRAMATAIEAPAPRSAERLPYLEAVIGKGFTYVFEMGAALEEIRDHELFHPQFKTFAEYFDLKWG